MQKDTNQMIKAGITGRSGFIGTHLANFLSLKKDVIELVPFEDDFFSDSDKLTRFVRECDVIVHLAALNRHNDPDEIYSTNLDLVKNLVSACEISGSRPYIIFSSSSQEQRDNPYGRSKLEGRKIFESWAERNGAAFTGLVIPNVFGPFGNPYYNSVVATFCHQLTHNEIPRIDVDANIRLIYVSELVEYIYNKIIFNKEKNREEATKSGEPVIEKIDVPHTSEKSVSGILDILKDFHYKYLERGIIPDLSDPFQKNLFNTFVCYIDHQDFFPHMLKKHEDERGVYVETIKNHSGGQVSFSTTKPGITRGNHFHTRKAERFAVIRGKARIQLRRIGTDKIMSFYLDGEKPSFVDMPVWYTHNITNIGDDELYTLFWINEHFDPNDADTYYEEV